MSIAVHFITGGGFIMYPLLVLSLIAIAIIIERFIAFSKMGGLAPGLLDSTIALCRDRRHDEALANCRDASGPLAACLAIVIEHRGQPVPRIERWVQETGQEYFVRLERFLPVLDTTTTISPLLGLLGTIVGMIGAFNAISAQQSHGNSDAVLRGVAEALYATASGITIAVICFVAYNYFASRLRTISAETEMAATRLLNLMGDAEEDQMQFKQQRELKRTKIEIIPMIDTIFFLLVFFMLSSLALTRLNGLPVNLPQASSAPRQPPAELTITIDKDRNVFVNKQPAAIGDLETLLVQKAGGASADLGAATVIINADASVPHGLVVKCIDDAREVGIIHFAIATAPDSSDAGR